MDPGAGHARDSAFLDMTTMPPNKPLPRSGTDNVLGRGPEVGVPEQVMRTRVFVDQWPAAERGR